MSTRRPSSRRSSTAKGARPPAQPPRVPGDLIRILLLIDNFCGPEGGTEQHLLFLQRELPRDRFDLHFGVITGIERMQPEAFPVRPVVLSGSTSPGIRGAWRRLRSLAALVREVEADVIHAFCPRSEIYALLAARLAGRGTVLGVRRNIGYWHTWSTRWLARLVARFGAEYAANCEAAREFAAKTEWIPRRRVTVIRNPVSARRLAEGLARVPPRSSLGALNGEHIVAMVGTVRPVKDYATFLRAANLVLRAHPSARFVVIGSQDLGYFGEMRALAQALRVADRVSWLGAISNPLCYLPLCDVGVLSSQSEAYSNALVEYAAAGLPAVATDVGGSGEIIEDGTTGFLVPAGDAVALAERISRLLSDEALRARLGANARQRVTTRCSQANIISQYATLYGRLARRNETRAGAAVE